MSSSIHPLNVRCICNAEKSRRRREERREEERERKSRPLFPSLFIGGDFFVSGRLVSGEKTRRVSKDSGEIDHRKRLYRTLEILVAATRACP